MSHSSSKPLSQRRPLYPLQPSTTALIKAISLAPIAYTRTNKETAIHDAQVLHSRRKKSVARSGYTDDHLGHDTGLPASSCCCQESGDLHEHAPCSTHIVIYSEQQDITCSDHRLISIGFLSFSDDTFHV